MIKFLKTIRFDASDEHVFAVPSPENEWAVSGAFEYVGCKDSDLSGKERQAFTNGFMGIGTFGRSTFATVASISEGELKQVERLLAAHLLDKYGAPGRAAALEAAREEISFVTELCEQPFINTVFAVRREVNAQGKIHEKLHEVRAADEEVDGHHARIWSIVEDEA